MLQGYWQAQLAPAMKAAVLADWADELEDWGQDQVRWALRQWRKENPDRRPNPGHISRLLRDARGKAIIARRRAEPEPDTLRKEGTADDRAEQVREIMKTLFREH